MKKSKWYSFNVCTQCFYRFNRWELSFSNGVCPGCGFASDGTICNSNRVTLRKITHHKWYQIFGRKITYEAKNDFSKEWLNFADEN